MGYLHIASIHLSQFPISIMISPNQRDTPFEGLVLATEIYWDCLNVKIRKSGSI